MGKKTRRPRGRPSGAKNKRTEAVEAKARKAAATLAEQIPGCFEGDSHALLMAVYKDPENALPIRVDAAKAALAYEKPRLSAVEHTGKDGAPIAVRQITADMSPQEAALEYARSLEADDA